MEYMPTINAILNSLSTVFILMGFYFIRKNKIKIHKRMMVSAISTSTLFLICYLTFHYYKQLDSTLITRFTHEGFISYIYYSILISHSILAVVILPLIIITVSYALKQKNNSHKKIVKWSFPIWLYVSFTGVIIYLMLYHLN